MISNIHYCIRYNRYIFQKIIDGVMYRKKFRTREQAEHYRDFFYITIYNGINISPTL